MLTPRVTSCTECASIPVLLDEIDCRLAKLAGDLYTNLIFILNKPVPAGAIMDLLNYRRILEYKYVDPEYACNYSIEMIASKVRRITQGCVKPCHPIITPIPLNCDIVGYVIGLHCDIIGSAVVDCNLSGSVLVQ